MNPANEGCTDLYSMIFLDCLSRDYFALLIILIVDIEFMIFFLFNFWDWILPLDTYPLDFEISTPAPVTIDFYRDFVAILAVNRLEMIYVISIEWIFLDFYNSRIIFCFICTITWWLNDFLNVFDML